MLNKHVCFFIYTMQIQTFESIRKKKKKRKSNLESYEASYHYLFFSEKNTTEKNLLMHLEEKTVGKIWH